VSGNPPAPLADDEPRRLGDYEIIGRLGQGGMGKVFLGRSPDGTVVAIKVIKPELAERPEFRARFRSEADSARRVRRFTTAAVLDADPDGPWPYLVTEYVEGPTLSRLVNRRGPLRPADLEQLALSVATALSAIHSAGIVHRDLTPANVLLSPVGPKVIDFGLARDFDGSGEFHRTARAAIGTPGYMAPEQIVDAPVTAAADIFAWGAITVFAATGRQPFGDGRIEALLYRILYEPANIEGVPPELAGLVDAALQKDPAQRPTAEELRVALVTGAQLAARPTEPAVSSSPAPAPVDDRPSESRRRGGLFRRSQTDLRAAPAAAGVLSTAATDLASAPPVASTHPATAAPPATTPAPAPLSSPPVVTPISPAPPTTPVPRTPQPSRSTSPAWPVPPDRPARAGRPHGNRGGPPATARADRGGGRRGGRRARRRRDGGTARTRGRRPPLIPSHTGVPAAPRQPVHAAR
jgi:serine/threonine protein kinase